MSSNWDNNYHKASRYVKNLPSVLNHTIPRVVGRGGLYSRVNNTVVLVPCQPLIFDSSSSPPLGTIPSLFLSISDTKESLSLQFIRHASGKSCVKPSPTPGLIYFLSTAMGHQSCSQGTLFPTLITVFSLYLFLV